MDADTPRTIWLSILLLVGCVGYVSQQAALAAAPSAGQVTVRDAVAIYTVPTQASQRGAGIDYVNARPMQLPRTHGSTAPSFRDGMVEALLSPASSSARPRRYPGSPGDGREDPVFLGRPDASALSRQSGAEVTPQEHGSVSHPFSTARADAYQGSTHKQFPYRASGKLFLNVGADTHFCSAALIRKGIVVTAAHCVAEYGGSFHTNFRFVPGYKNGYAPYGVWRAATAAVLDSWRNGTDPCTDGGAVCVNDVGVIRLAPKNGVYAGQRTGFYGYGINGFGFVSGTAQVTQIGYPVCLDNGNLMERNESQGYVHWPSSGNTIIGSLMCGGSSGGPWLINFGRRPNLTGTGNGSAFTANTVIGVTSWGYVGSAPKQQGASRFTSANIGRLANRLCGGWPNPC
jgi:V8-like Glu-specific endopeptidase